MAQKLPKIKSNIKIIEKGKTEELFASVEPVKMRSTINLLGARANMNKTIYL